MPYIGQVSAHHDRLDCTVCGKPATAISSSVKGRLAALEYRITCAACVPSGFVVLTRIDPDRAFGIGG